MEKCEIEFDIISFIFRSIGMDVGEYKIVANVDHEEIQHWTGADGLKVSNHWRRARAIVAGRILGVRRVEKRRQHTGQAHCSFDPQRDGTMHQSDAQRQWPG